MAIGSTATLFPGAHLRHTGEDGPVDPLAVPFQTKTANQYSSWQR